MFRSPRSTALERTIHESGAVSQARSTVNRIINCLQLDGKQLILTGCCHLSAYALGFSLSRCAQFQPATPLQTDVAREILRQSSTALRPLIRDGRRCVQRSHKAVWALGSACCAVSDDMQAVATESLSSSHTVRHNVWTTSAYRRQRCGVSRPYARCVSGSSLRFLNSGEHIEMAGCL